MTTKTLSQSPWADLRAWLRQPLVATTLAVVYIVVVVAILLGLNRLDTWFPLHTTLAFPPLVVSPFIILALPLKGWVKGVLIGVLLVIGVPLIGLYDSYYLELMILICIFAALALGLNIVVGSAGLLDLGYIAFFAVGAYLWAMFTSPAPTIFQTNGWIVPTNSPLVGLVFVGFILLGLVLAAIVGILLGLPVLRVRGDYLAIVTLGFGEMIRVLANNLNQPVNFTNGPQGLYGIGSPTGKFLVNPAMSIASIFNIRLSNPEPVAQQLMFYFIAIVVVGIIILLNRRLDDSPIGRAWTAIREDEVAAIAMGVPLVRMKLLAFAAGAACAGAIGVLYGAKQTLISPDSFILIQTINVLAMVIVGGMGGIRGAVLGACIVTLLNLHFLTNFALQVNNLRNIDYVVPIINFHISDWPDQLTPDKYQRFVFGILLVAMMIFRPAGILPEARRKLELRGHSAEDEEPAIQSEPVKAELAADAE